MTSRGGLRPVSSLRAPRCVNSIVVSSIWIVFNWAIFVYFRLTEIKGSRHLGGLNLLVVHQPNGPKRDINM